MVWFRHHLLTRAALTAGAVLAPAVGAGCGTDVNSRTAGVTPSSHAPIVPARNAPVPPRGNTPASVAIAYTIEVTSGREAEAESLVDPAFRPALESIAAGMTRATVEKLTVASVRATGQTADVVLTGKICVPSGCVSNADPSASNPLFIVHEVQDGGRWLVAFPGT